MDLKEYQVLSRNTEKAYPLPKRLAHAAVGLMTEIGEFATQVKRIAVYGKSRSDVKDGASLLAHMLEELGDAMFYAVIPFNALEQIATIPEHSWLESLAAQKGIEGSAGWRDITPEQEADLLLDVTLEMGVAIGRYIQNMDSAGEHALVQIRAVIGLINDACQLLDTDLEHIMVANIEKLQGANGRYGKNGYSDAAAEARADKGGLDARNS